MSDVIKLKDEVSIDLRNRELQAPGLVEQILETLAQEFKGLARSGAFSPAGSESGILGGLTGESFAKSFYYRLNKRGSTVRVATLSARLANIFESSSYGARGPGFRGPVGKYPILTRTALAFRAFGPEERIEEMLADWAEKEAK